MMKIGIITSSLSKTNGWGRYSFEVIKGLKNFAETKVVSQPILPPALSHPFKKICCLPKIMKHLKGCDIIHCLVEPYAQITALASKLLRKPFIINGVGTYAVEPLDTVIQGMGLKYAYRNAAKILCISRFTEQEILKRVSLKNTCVVNLGVDYDKFQKYGNMGRKSAEKTIISVGALKNRKGYHISIPAVGEVKKRYPNLRYYIVGNQSGENYFDELKNLVKQYNLEKNVTFLADISDDELISLYHQADLFLLTPINIDNNFEGFGLVYLEANACGLPVIGTFDCGAEDIIQNKYNGLIVPQGNIAQTAQALLTLLDDPAFAQKLGENGKEIARKMSWENTINQYLKIYKSILNAELPSTEVKVKMKKKFSSPAKI